MTTLGFIAVDEELIDAPHDSAAVAGRQLLGTGANTPKPLQNSASCACPSFELGESSKRQAPEKAVKANVKAASKAAAAMANTWKVNGQCNQNQANVIGMHNCEVQIRQNSHGKDEKAPGANNGNACPDNLSTGSAWVVKADEGLGRCVPFGTEAGAAGDTMVSLKQGGMHNGIINKMGVFHPHKSARNVGVFALKRIICGRRTGKCNTFKVVQCFAAPAIAGKESRMFHSMVEKAATFAEKIAFAKKVTAEAWVNPGKSSAKLKPEWRCSGKNYEIAEGPFNATLTPL